MTGKFVPLKKIAEILGLDRTNARRVMLKYGFAPAKVRAQGSRGQLTLALKEEEVQELCDMRAEDGFYQSDLSIATNGEGEFYIIQLVPELDPLRLKFGFASNSQARIQAHRTVAPTCTLFRTWPCKKMWEQSAIDSITRNGCKRIGGEVYQVTSLEETTKKAVQFFGIMPKSGKEEV